MSRRSVKDLRRTLAVYGAVLCLSAALVLSLPSPARALSLAIGGTPGAGSFIPFGGLTAGLITAINTALPGQMPQPRFQQVYDASSFAAFGPIIRIDEISFTQETVQIGNSGLLGGDGAENCSGTRTKCGLFTITLSTTSKPVNGLLPEPPSPPDASAYTSMAEFNANGFPILEGLQVVFAQQILLSDYYDSGLGVLTITTLMGSPFFYDPNDGNLIIDVQITDFGTSNDLTQGASSLFFNATDDKDLGSEPGPYSIVNNFDGRDNDSYGLATAFEFALVPEPSAGILLGLGLVGLGCLRRGRRAQR